jgi:hypothetical protein
MGLDFRGEVKLKEEQRCHNEVCVGCELLLREARRPNVEGRIIAALGKKEVEGFWRKEEDFRWYYWTVFLYLIYYCNALKRARRVSGAKSCHKPDHIITTKSTFNVTPILPKPSKPSMNPSMK